MNHETIRPAGWPKPRGYANGMLARPGRFLAVAGQVAWDNECRIVSTEFAAQFGQALRNVRSVVEAAGGRPEDVISLTIYVTDKARYIASLTEVGREYRDVMGRHFPAMALVEIAGLLEPNAEVEIQALAVIADR